MSTRYTPLAESLPRATGVPSATPSPTPVRLPRPPRLAAWLLVAACSVFAIWVGRPDFAMAPGAPFLTDLGGHLVALQHLVDVSLPQGALRGWSHDWFAGYPTFYFYFPLPALAIAAFSALVPLEVAAKLVAVCAPALLPPAAYTFVRALGHGRMAAVSAAVAMVPYLTSTHQYVLGGNVLSSVIGEYSYAVGLALLLWYLACVARAMRGESVLVMLVLLLAATALSHSVTTLFAVLASCAALTSASARRQVLASWLLGFGVTAWWSVPFLARSGYMGDIAWMYVPSPGDLFPLVVLMVLPWGMVSAARLRPFHAEVRLLAALCVASAMVYLVPQTYFAPGRALPVWHLSLFLWVGIGVGSGLQLAFREGRRLGLAGWTAGLVMLPGLGIAQMELVRGRAAELLEATPTDAAEFRRLTAALVRLPPGLLHWQHANDHESILSSNMGLARLPAVVPGLRTTVGLLHESAYLSPAFAYVRRDMMEDTVVASGALRNEAPADPDPSRKRLRLRELGVDYFVSFTGWGHELADAGGDGFELLASDPAWRVWRVAPPRLVEPLKTPPVTVAASPLADEVVNWLSRISDPVTWRVLDHGGDIDFAALPVASPDDEVQDVELGRNMVRFRTTAPGVPHVIRTAYFPNWRAYGAAGPFVAVPGYMLVVPTGPDVVLQFERTWAENAGLLLTLLSATLLAVIGLRQRSAWRLRRGGGTGHAPGVGVRSG